MKMGDVPSLLATYPRLRPPLPKGWQTIYTEVYKCSREGKTFLYRLAQSLESWMHREVLCGANTPRLLEIGAGTLNHVQYEPAIGRYDAIEPFRELYSNQPEASRINRLYGDISEIPLSERYERIVSVAVLEHIADLPRVVARAGLLLEKGGMFSAGIPSEGGFLWGLSWRVTVGLVARLKYGMDYGDLMRHEHLSTGPEVIAVVSYFFRNCQVTRFPMPFHNLSLYACILASDPILDRCAIFANKEIEC